MQALSLVRARPLACQAESSPPASAAHRSPSQLPGSARVVRTVRCALQCHTRVVRGHATLGGASTLLTLSGTSGPWPLRHCGSAAVASGASSATGSVRECGRRGSWARGMNELNCPTVHCTAAERRVRCSSACLYRGLLKYRTNCRDGLTTRFEWPRVGRWRSFCRRLLSSAGGTCLPARAHVRGPPKLGEVRPAA